MINIFFIKGKFLREKRLLKLFHQKSRPLYHHHFKTEILGR